MTDTSHDRPASLTRVLADLHVDEVTSRNAEDPEQRVYATLVPPQGGRLDVIRTRHRKWWLEGTYGQEKIRVALTLEKAAEIAACSFVESWCVYHPGVTGGERLDRLVQQMSLRNAVLPDPSEQI